MEEESLVVYYLGSGEQNSGLMHCCHVVFGVALGTCHVMCLDALGFRVLSHLWLALLDLDQKKKYMYIYTFISTFSSFSHHTGCSGPNQLMSLVKQTKMQPHKSQKNIDITRWPHASWNMFPKLLFD